MTNVPAVVAPRWTASRELDYARPEFAVDHTLMIIARQPKSWLAALIAMLVAWQSLAVAAMPCQMLSGAASHGMDAMEMEHAMMGMPHDMSDSNRAPALPPSHDCCAVTAYCAAGGCAFTAVGDVFSPRELTPANPIAESYPATAPEVLAETLFRPPISVTAG